MGRGRRREAGRGRRRRSDETVIPEGGDDGTNKAGEREEGKGFFACYLLCSLSPRHKGHTYIGFTVNPRRRIRQHNGEITSGAWRTKRKRPWEMILCIYGFPTNVNALQFEWAWQHPRESLAVRKAAESFKSLSGITNKIKIAYTMLTLAPWENFNLTVNFFSTKYMKHTVGCSSLPKNMRVNVCVMDELPCYVNGQTLDDNDDPDVDEVCNNEDGKLAESLDMPPDLYDDNERIQEYTTLNDHNEERESDRSRCQLDVFIHSPAKAYNEYSWQINATQPPKLIDSYPVTPSKPLNSSGNGGGESSSSPSMNQFVLINGSTSIEPSTPMSSGADNNFRKRHKCFSPDDNVINLVSPSSCIIHLEDKRAPVCRKIIDLTDSPEVIHF